MLVFPLISISGVRLGSEPNSLFSMIANAFRRYFDPRNQLDEAYVQSLLEKVSSDLDRLLRQDAEVRSIIGINGADSIQEAVARILLSAYH